MKYKNTREKTNAEYEAMYKKVGKANRMQKGGPKFIGGESATLNNVANDIRNTVKSAKKTAKKAMSSVVDVAKKTGTAIERGVHNKAFPTKQDKIYNKKVSNDDWKNSPTRKKLIDLEK